MVHVELRAAFRRLGHRLLRLALGADEQDAAALGHRVAHDLQRLVQQRNRLRQVDDVNAVAVTIDVFAHLGVPAGGLVAIMHASFQQLTHGELGKSHASSFFRFDPRRRRLHPRMGATGGPCGISPRNDPDNACEVARV